MFEVAAAAESALPVVVEDIAPAVAVSIREAFILFELFYSMGKLAPVPVGAVTPLHVVFAELHLDVLPGAAGGCVPFAVAGVDRVDAALKAVFGF